MRVTFPATGIALDSLLKRTTGGESASNRTSRGAAARVEVAKLEFILHVCEVGQLPRQAYRRMYTQH